MNKFQTIIDTVFLGGTVAKLKVALKAATLKMLQAQEAQTQLEDALLANHEIRLALEAENKELNRELTDERLAKEAFFRDADLSELDDTIDFDNPEYNQ